MRHDFDNWQKARQYIAWATRQGFSRETLLEIPRMADFGLSEEDQALLINLLNERT